MLPFYKLIFDEISNNQEILNIFLEHSGFKRVNASFSSFILSLNPDNIPPVLRNALSVNIKEYEEIVKETYIICEIINKMKKAEIDRYERSNFNPKIKIEFEYFRPTGVFNAMGLAAMRTYPLEREILKLQVQKQLEFVRTKINEIFSDYYEKNLYKSTLGKILSIKYYFEYEYYIEIDFNPLISNKGQVK
jgi:hypothetical protein